MNLGKITALSLCLVLVASCASISQNTIAQIEQPVNCSSAEQDVAYLEEEKAGGLKRTLAFVTALLPPGSFIVIIRGILGKPRGIWRDKFKVASGSYNQKMEDKIERTQQQCGM